MEATGIGKVSLLVKSRSSYNISIKMIESEILNSVKTGQHVHTSVAAL